MQDHCSWDIPGHFVHSLVQYHQFSICKIEAMWKVHEVCTYIGGQIAKASMHGYRRLPHKGKNVYTSWLEIYIVLVSV